MKCSWDTYCERGEECCLDQNCGCVDSRAFRWMAARARGFSILRSWIHVYWRQF